MRRSLWHLTFYVTAGAFVLTAMPASGDNAWGSYHWERYSNPVSLTLGNNFKYPVWDSHFADAVSDWNLSSALALTAVPGGTSPRRCRAASGTIEVCADSYGNNGWLGLAQIWVSGDHIAKAIAKMNDYYFGWATYDTPAWRQFVMCQEIGHDWGLGHQDGNFYNGNLGTCMDYTNDPARDDGYGDNLGPDSHDYDQLDLIYAHEDGAPAPEPEPEADSGNKPCRGGPKKCGARGAPPAFEMELADIGQWGRLIGTSRDGGQSVFVQDFGNGSRVFTHVTWTLEIAEGLAVRR